MPIGTYNYLSFVNFPPLFYTIKILNCKFRAWTRPYHLINFVFTYTEAIPDPRSTALAQVCVVYMQRTALHAWCC